MENAGKKSDGRGKRFLSPFICALAVGLFVQPVISFNDLTDPPPKFSGHDVTEKIFGASKNLEVYPVAFGDFNADKLTDVFAISRNRSTFYVYRAYEEEPLLRQKIECGLEVSAPEGETLQVKILGVSPGDFNGDGLMDVMVSYLHPGSDGLIDVEVFRGYLDYIDCNHTNSQWIQRFIQEPLVVDLDGDMVMDLIGEYLPAGKNDTKDSVKAVWKFEPNDQIKIQRYDMHVTKQLKKYKSTMKNDGYDYEKARWIVPSANAYVDTNSDTIPELIAVSEIRSEHCTRHYIERYDVKGPSKDKWEFTLSHYIPLDECNQQLHVIGQPIYVDLSQNGELIQLLPTCGEKNCKSPGMKAIQDQKNDAYRVVDIDLQFHLESEEWTYVLLHNVSIDEYYNSPGLISLRVGDYNMDGFPDLIGTMMTSSHSWAEKQYRAVIFENVPCNSENRKCPFPRTFQLDFQSLSTYGNVTMSTFYDIYDDGLLDVMLVRRTNVDTKKDQDKYAVFGYQSKPDYDANYLKVVVTTGRECSKCPNIGTPYGNVIPGPIVRYNTTTQTGELQTSVAAQNYRSTHRPLDLPYVFFGIGHSPNFIENLDVSISNGGIPKKHSWTQLIPNSQIIIIPKPPGRSNEWRAKIFLPSNVAALHTFGVLVGFCAGIFIIIVIFFWRERREDKKDRLLESHRFMM